MMNSLATLWDRLHGLVPRRQAASPYLSHIARLGDVIAAIQVLGSFPFHAILPEDWDYHFRNARSTPDGKWDFVFEQHPEFFQIERNQRGEVALKWRFAYERTYDPRKLRDYTPEQRDTELDPEQQKKLHRRPLTADQVGVLMNIALELHARALAQAQDVRWKIPIVASFIGALAGGIFAVIGAIITAKLRGS